MRKIVVGCMAVLALVVMGLGIWSMVEFKQTPRLVARDPETGRLYSPEVQPEAYPVRREIPKSYVTLDGDSDIDAEEASIDTAPPQVIAPLQLDMSDDTVLRAVADLDPELAKWLLPKEQIRKWVTLVNQAAEGHFPLKNRPIEYPLAPFKTIDKSGKQWMSPSNFSRADTLIYAVTQIPPKRAAQYFQYWEPLLQQAQSELGIKKQFREQLLRAMDRTLAVQPRESEIELIQGERAYHYADNAMEKATGVERLMWRLGTDNTLKIQAYLLELKPLLEAVTP